MSTTFPARQFNALPKGLARRVAPGLLTLLAMILILVVCGTIQPRIWSTAGLTLIMSSIVPLVCASMAQMVMMSIGDIDLGIGAFIGLVTTVTATLLRDTPTLGVLVLVACVLGYAVLGALVQLRSVPSLIATLGASFIWLGLALFILPLPGGLAPDWLMQYSMWYPPVIPTPVISMIVITAITWCVTQSSGLGVRFRSLGSNPVALARSGSSALWTRVMAYAVVGVLGVVAGIALSAEIGSGDASSAGGYTLVSVAAVILGGGTFHGGRTVAWGTLFGAVTLGLLTVLLTLLNLSSNIQPAIQALIVIGVLAGRLILERVLR